MQETEKGAAAEKAHIAVQEVMSGRQCLSLSLSCLLSTSCRGDSMPRHTHEYT